MKSNFKSIINSNVPVLIDFYADWCEPCKMLTTILKQVKGELGDTIKIVKIDIDKNPRIAAKYKVKSIPTMILFNNGKALWKQSGILQKEEIINVVNLNIN